MTGLLGLAGCQVPCREPQGSLAHIPDVQYGPPQPDHQGVQATFTEGHPEAEA